jgi:MFS family permease
MSSDELTETAQIRSNEKKTLDEGVNVNVTEASSVISSLYSEGEFDGVYLEKSRLLSEAMQEIGMGKYQWQLFVLAGFGWMADNMWPIVTSLIVPQVALEFHPPDGRSPYLVLAQNLGLLAGAVFWSFSADIVGRRWAFNLTFLITGVWGLVAGSSPNFAALGVFEAFWSFGVGGNLPVDSAIFLEALPGTHQYLLTVMSIWWSFGQLLANFVAWGVISNYSCPKDGPCPRSSNMGWRYLLFTIGGVSIICFLSRFVLFSLFESPKYYLSRGQDEKAVEVIHKIAAVNKKTVSLTIEHLQAVERQYARDAQETGAEVGIVHDTSTKGIIKERLGQFRLNHIREAFGTKKLALSTSLVVLVWALIGLAFPLYNAYLPYFLSNRTFYNEPTPIHIVYRNSTIIAVLGIPGALLAGLLVELKIGRKGAMSVSTILTGVFLFASTTAKSSNALLGWNCAYNFCSNIMYGVLYAYTPEIFPARIRGTAIGMAASANRVLGVFSPIIAIFANLNTSSPVYASGALFLVAGLIMLAFPYEPRGKASL